MTFWIAIFWMNPRIGSPRCAFRLAVPAKPMQTILKLLLFGLYFRGQNHLDIYVQAPQLIDGQFG
jgi:hypothetical protein